LIVFAPLQEAKAAEATSNVLSTAAAATASQWRQQDRQWRNRRGVRVVNRTRIVRRGFRTYREVVQYRYRPNGSVTVRIVSRTRIA
jgi:CO/xanthine dehydrogenase Mo-binding subunit